MSLLKLLVLCLNLNCSLVMFSLLAVNLALMNANLTLQLVNHLFFTRFVVHLDE